MALKKDIKAWAIKLRGRSFRSLNSLPFLYMTKLDASSVAMRVAKEHGITAEPIRVRVRVEEIE
jgi:hypothetical protein